MTRKSSTSSKDRWQSGAVATEFAILVPVLLLCLFGIIQLGSVLYLHSNMENAAREAARRMSVGAATVVEAEQVARNYLALRNLSFTVTA
ncbi:MAG: TadE family protein, partial [Acidiferrobacterales bacterium]